jgi:ubiquinone/menaquinone biosynthesis C-methylase UbiE
MSRYDAIAEWYDEVSSRWAASGPDGSASWLTRLLGPGQGWCLDLACGGGRHAAAIEGTSRRVVELELSAGQLRVGRRRGLQHLVRADVTRLPVSDASVGAVVLAYVHTDVDDVAPVFAEVERVLWPGGRLVFLGVHPCFVGHSWSTGRRRSSCTPATTRGLAARTRRTSPRTGWAAASGRGRFRWRSCSTRCWPPGCGWTGWRSSAATSARPTCRATSPWWPPSQPLHPDHHDATYTRVSRNPSSLLRARQRLWSSR